MNQKMIDISNITYKDENLKTIKGIFTLNINHKYSKNFTVPCYKVQMKEPFQKPIVTLMFKIGSVIILNK